MPWPALGASACARAARAAARIDVNSVSYKTGVTSGRGSFTIWVVTVALYVEDVLLVDRCLTGEPAATRELFRRHRNRVHACLFRVLGGNREMDDLLQEAFLQVFQSLRGWRAEASLATWIDRVSVRVAYRYLSQHRRRVPTDPMSDDDAFAGAEPGPNAHRQLARDGVQRLYAVLDE